ncbi:YdeI/OmpD-associated family protein [Croceimicrobium sp.]|uniref:YdeI/OmpD-associated family protein n=1 Tax=Croceimicrobium sp. TaxID=2828340 RepID=UPI003BABCD96
MNPEVDSYFTDGCGRCDLYQSPDCKVHRWAEPLQQLRSILLSSPLVEERKWSMPTYTHKGKNILILSAFKDYCSLNFFKGALLKDPKNLLVFAGPNSRVPKLFKFEEGDSVLEHEEAILDFIQQAIAVEEAGVKIPASTPKPIDYPEELQQAFREDAGFEAAFESLSPGRKRAYLIQFNGAKQSKTRWARIEKWKDHILIGKGIHDR